MLSVEKLATPPTAGIVVVPDNVPVGGFAPSATVTSEVKPVTVLPPGSCAETSIAGLIDAPAVVVTGWTVNASRVAWPTATSNRALVAVLSPDAVNDKV